MNTILTELQHKLIVSCQAFPDSPLYGPDYLQKMAMCAIKGGAGGIRACWPDNVKAIRSITDLPIIGINKVGFDDPQSLDKVYITPSFESAAEVIEAGANILGIDCTPRGRTYDDINKIIEQIKKHYPEILIMADLSTVEEGMKAEEMGVDIVSTTLAGYTRSSLNPSILNKSTSMDATELEELIHEEVPDLDLIKALKKSVKVKINAEGRFWEVDQVVDAIKYGADMVTVGAAITMPEKITSKFVSAINKVCPSN